MTRFFSKKAPVTPFQVVEELLQPIQVMAGQADKAAQFGKPANVAAFKVLSACVAAITETMNGPKVPLDTVRIAPSQ